jgi:hypothetical protein
MRSITFKHVGFRTLAHNASGPSVPIEGVIRNAAALDEYRAGCCCRIADDVAFPDESVVVVARGACPSECMVEIVVVVEERSAGQVETHVYFAETTPPNAVSLVGSYPQHVVALRGAPGTFKFRRVTERMRQALIEHRW